MSSQATIDKALPMRVLGSEWTSGNATEPTTVPVCLDNDAWGGYVFSLSYREHELVRLDITRDGDAKPLTAVHLQRVPLGALDRFARAWVREALARDEAEPTRLIERFPDPLDWLEATSQVEELDMRDAEMCRRYLELGTEKAWREILGREFRMSPATVPSVISQARKRHFLTPIPRGQRGGELTPKAQRLLSGWKTAEAWDKATEQMLTAARKRDEKELAE